MNIPRTESYSVWRQRFLDADVQELAEAYRDCIVYDRRAQAEGRYLKGLLYRAVWAKLIKERILELLGRVPARDLALPSTATIFTPEEVQEAIGGTLST